MIKDITETELRDVVEQHHTLKATAAALGLTESTAYRWCREYGIVLPGGRTSHLPRTVDGYGDLTAKHVLMAIIQDDYRPAQRTCLKCQTLFASVSPAFRICPQCRSGNTRGMVALDERKVVKRCGYTS